MWKPVRRDFLKGAAATAALPAAPAPRRPNIIIVMADQHRAGLTKRSGYPLDTMPALDRLAARGAAFDHAWCTSPLCVPSRVSLLTGRWPHAHRVRENSAGQSATFSKDIYDVAKELGYRTGLAGKNHSYLRPQKLDFWREYGHLGGWKASGAPKELGEFDDWMERLNHGVSPVATPFPVETQLPYRIVSDAIEFIQGAGGNPFALWVSFPEPHNPYQVPKPYFDMFPPGEVPGRAAGPEALERKGFKWRWLGQLEEATYPGYDNTWRRTKSNYLGMLRLIDDQLARLVAHLERARLMDDTIVVYLADHGDYLTDYGLMRKGVELPECLTRIPMVWAGRGVRAQSANPAFVSIADVMPTFCEAMGAGIPVGAQGRSLWPLLRGEAYPKDEFRGMYAEVGFGGMHYDESDKPAFSMAQMQRRPDSIKTFDELNPVTQSGLLKMVRLGDWKLCFDMLGEGQLYDLAADPGELKNLYGDPRHAPQQMRLLEELLQWTIRTEDNLPTARYPAKWPERNWYAPYGRK